MPRHLISDVHEWMNEVPFRPYLERGESTAWRTGQVKTAGKEDPIEFDSSLIL